MSNVIKFPKTPKPRPVVRPSAQNPVQRVPIAVKPNLFLRCVLGAILVVIILFWPILKWFVAYDILFQVIRTMYYWNTPSVHAGWTLSLHIAVVAGIACIAMVSVKEKWFE